jgi:hypothetical protein
MLKFFDILPGWAWALIVAGLLVLNGVMLVQVAQADRATAQAQAKAAGERADHAIALAGATASV